VLLYALTLEELALVAPHSREASVLMVLWPVLVLLGLAPGLACESAIVASAGAPRLERWRPSLAARSARIVTWAVVAFAGFNFAAARSHKKVDLSYFKRAQPSHATLGLVRGLTSPLTIHAFFAPGSDVGEQALAYLAPLAHASPHVTLHTVDHALVPTTAKRLRVTSNGTLAFENGERRRTLRIGSDIEAARKVLRQLDSKVQKELFQTVREHRVAYITMGHGERDFQPITGDKRLPIADFRRLLQGQGFEVRRLGYAEGIAKAIPDDATLLCLLGPTESLFEGERAAIESYLARGGRLLMALEPDTGPGEVALPETWGLQVGEHLVANDTYRVRMQGHRETPFHLVSTKPGLHSATRSLRAGGSRVGVVMLGAGNLSKKEELPPNVKVFMTLRGMDGSWIDANGNGAKDRGEETQEISFAAAIERKHAGTDPPVSEGGKPESVVDTGDARAQANAVGGTDAASNGQAETPTPPPMRVVVVTDADMFADGIVRNPGNALFALDTVRWLVGDEKLTGGVENDEDVPIVHRRDEDTLWFYGTSFVVPALVLGSGLWFGRRSPSRRRRRRGKA
jgi:hypothetical protein